jgi:hypothetical protein
MAKIQSNRKSIASTMNRGSDKGFRLEFNGYSAYLGIAGFSFSDEVLEQANRYGIGIAKQVGESVEIEASNLKAY